MRMNDEDPQIVRAQRVRRKNQDRDEEEDNQDATFKANPLDAVNRHAKQRTQKSIEKQVSYFGNAIQPFHMRDQQQLGDVDEDGFFVFNRKSKVRDAWLDSIGQADDAEVADQLVKKIKEGGRFQSVYEAGEQLNKNLAENQDEQEDKNSYDGGGIQEAPESEQHSENQGGLSIQQLIEIMIELIPENSNANNYMKKLKKQKKMEEYNKLLTISNEYIEKSGEYDILTKKKEDLEEMLDEIVESRKKKLKLNQQPQQKEKQVEEQPIQNWDDEQQEELEEPRKRQNTWQQKNEVEQNQSDSAEEDNDDDNIF